MKLIKQCAALAAAPLLLASFQFPAMTAGGTLSAPTPIGPILAATAGPIAVTGITPTQTEVVGIDDGQLMAVLGSGFLGVTGVKIDGKALPSFPPSFTIVSDGKVTFNMPLVSGIGPVIVELSGPSGSSQTTLSVVANASPTIEMKSSTPAFLIQAIGLNLIVSGDPGDLVFVFGSPDLAPTKVTPWADIDLAIGRDGTSLFFLGTPIIGPEGYAQLHIPMQGAKSGFEVYVQTMLVTAASGYAPMLHGSNVQAGVVLF
jgi:hypothetical protein